MVKEEKIMSVLIVTGIFLKLLGSTGAQKTAYYMDTSLDCGYIGVQDIGRDQAVTVYAKTTDTSSTTQLGCTINFQTTDNDATIKIDFESFIVNNCDVKLYISGDASGAMSSYSCGDDPSNYFSNGRSVTLTLHRTSVAVTEYNFRLKLVAVRDSRWVEPNGDDGDDATVRTTVYVTVGVIIGIIVLVIIVTVIVAVICCRRRQSRPGQVYRGPQAGVVTSATTYPMQNQPGYQPVQAGYQPSAQPGYQPPPQPGYQPPPQGGFQPQPCYQPAGYPLAPQQGYAGYQTGPDANGPEKASDPSIGIQSSPYPGN